MKSLGEWILDKLGKVAVAGSERHSDYTQGYRDGCAEALHSVLCELKVREEAERERVNENVKALDGLADETLVEKEGGAE